MTVPVPAEVEASLALAIRALEAEEALVKQWGGHSVTLGLALDDLRGLRDSLARERAELQRADLPWAPGSQPSDPRLRVL
jgi:hypothetical protein